MAARARDPRVLIMPRCEPPRRLIRAMANAGAQREIVKGENLHLVWIHDDVQSRAWRLYQDWTCSLGEVYPLVQAVFTPPAKIRETILCPPNAIAVFIMQEANSVINHMAPLAFVDVAAGILVFSGPLPEATMTMTNVRDAKVAVTALLHAISDPGANFSVINALHPGQYICTVHYVWLGAYITVPIFRL